MKDYYKILEISTNANKDEMKKAFRQLAKKYHPDRNSGDENALRMFQEVNEAYEVLSNDKSKEEYDKKRAAFNTNKNKQTKGNEKKSAKNSRTSQDKADSINDLNKYFQSFFGFEANSNNIDKSKLKRENNNPIDTSNIFDSFFKVKKK